MTAAHGSDAPACVTVKDLSVTLGGLRVLIDIEWTVPVGTLSAVIGPNGGGKTTLLRALVGRVAPAAGLIRVFGRDPVRARPLVSYVPQHDEMHWEVPIRVIDVALQGRLARLPWWRKPGPADQELALAALERMRLADQRQRPVGILSGGQRQRLLLARALAQDARLILLDEPTTGLDATSQHDLLETLEALRAEGRTVIATTHDLDCLTDRFDHVLCLRQRTIRQGRPQEVLTPEALAELFGRHVPFLTPAGEVTMVEHH